MILVTASDHWQLCTAVFLVLWHGYIVVSRRYFHPLSKVPGPLLWSLSSLPILYHQAFREGKLIHVLPKLHERYGTVTISANRTSPKNQDIATPQLCSDNKVNRTPGPIIRISPNEIHLNDPINYDKIYNILSKFTKDPSFYGPIEGPVRTPVILTVISNEVHRARRSALNPFFSRRSVLDLEAVVRSKSLLFCEILSSALSKDEIGIDHECKVKKKVFNAHGAIRAFATDVITEYAYANCWDFLDEEDFGAWYPRAIRAVQTMFVWFQTFPILIPVFGWVPDRVNMLLFPPFRKWFESLDVIRNFIKEVRREIDEEVKPERRTIFHDLIDPPLELTGKKRQQLSDEAVFADAVVLTGAGVETTGATAERAIYEVISNPVIYKTLVRELRDAFPDAENMTLMGLEALPYLSAVIKESLRINPGTPGHLPRVVPPGGATFNNISLPPGTVVSMSIWLMHHDPVAFPNPETFDPNRWLDLEDEVRDRERCLVPFSRGSRNCVGKNLAMCELYFLIGTMFYRFDDLEVHPDFGKEDLEMVELLVGYRPRKARKFRVVRRGSGE